MPDAAPTATEVVVRPDAGTLARGVWEAPPWMFYAGATVVLLAAALYGAARFGWLKRRSPRER
jgi:hypothetical protein